MTLAAERSSGWGARPRRAVRRNGRPGSVARQEFALELAVDLDLLDALLRLVGRPHPHGCVRGLAGGVVAADGSQAPLHGGQPAGDAGGLDLRQVGGHGAGQRDSGPLGHAGQRYSDYRLAEAAEDDDLALALADVVLALGNAVSDEQAAGDQH